jgi:hypothetical protein
MVRDVPDTCRLYPSAAVAGGCGWTRNPPDATARNHELLEYGKRVLYKCTLKTPKDTFFYAIRIRAKQKADIWKAEIGFLLSTF